MSVETVGKASRGQSHEWSEVVICAPSRTPVGRYGGVFKQLTAVDLASTLIRSVVERIGLDPAAVDEVVLGQCYPSMEAPAMGRAAALDAGLPDTVAGFQIDRRCGSGLQAVLSAAASVRAGSADLILAGGVESMSTAIFHATGARWGTRGADLVLHDSLARGRVTAGGRLHPVPGGMLETAENLRREYRISRQEQDEYALESHVRAVAAQRRGAFADEIVPVAVPSKGSEITVDIDEHPRPDATLAHLTGLRPVLENVDREATVTAGNASGQNDGAALCVVTTRGRAAELGLTSLVRLVGSAVAGVAPERMGIGPVPAVARLLDRVGVPLANIDLIELNEAFAAQVLACTREWDFGASDFARLNVNGSGISLGHPVGATGGRILATLAHEMSRRGAGLGLETMCIGGGQGLAALFELVG